MNWFDLHKEFPDSHLPNTSRSQTSNNPDDKTKYFLEESISDKEQLAFQSKDTNNFLNTKFVITNSLPKNFVRKIYKTIQNHPLYSWQQAHGDGICTYRAVLMRAMAETICSELPGAAKALAFVYFLGLHGSPRSPRQMNKSGYYASQYMPFYMKMSDGFRIPLRENMISCLNSIRIPHVALCVNVDGEGPMVIDPAYAIDSISDDLLTIKDWIKQLNEYNSSDEHIEHGYVTIQSEWYPWTMSHLYLLTGGEALLSTELLTMPTLEHIINVLTMYRLMWSENLPTIDHIPTLEEVNVYFEEFAMKHNQKNDLILYMNDVKQYVKQLGKNFPPPGPTPLLPPPKPVYVILNKDMVTITTSLTFNGHFLQN
ncbi:unnamed protein product [Adineta ricciae]|uniref:Uncharacterized protein n=1 Tax=Adineta ricciae TaxID=249248 RepID=A0A814JMX4_ADIRI|nr:unnamed protein product [Adineta ricciae]CAF1426791.1 unnamed protein product [Adineta ricciae]